MLEDAAAVNIPNAAEGLKSAEDSTSESSRQEEQTHGFHAPQPAAALSRSSHLTQILQLSRFTHIRALPQHGSCPSIAIFCRKDQVDMSKRIGSSAVCG